MANIDLQPIKRRRTAMKVFERQEPEEEEANQSVAQTFLSLSQSEHVIVVLVDVVHVQTSATLEPKKYVEDSTSRTKVRE